MKGISGRGRRPYCPTTQGRSMGGMGAWVLKSVGEDERSFFICTKLLQPINVSTLDEIGKLIEEQDEESANTVVVLLASNGIYYARGLTVVLLR